MNTTAILESAQFVKQKDPLSSRHPVWTRGTVSYQILGGCPVVGVGNRAKRFGRGYRINAARFAVRAARILAHVPANTRPVWDEERNQKVALRALSRDTWSVCDDLRPDSASDDEIVALFAAAIIRCRSSHQADRLFSVAAKLVDE
jgi:hypothetical protein